MAGSWSVWERSAPVSERFVLEYANLLVEEVTICSDGRRDDRFSDFSADGQQIASRMAGSWSVWERSAPVSERFVLEYANLLVEEVIICSDGRRDDRFSDISADGSQIASRMAGRWSVWERSAPVSERFGP